MSFRTVAIMVLCAVSTASNAQRLGGNSGGGGNIKPPTPLTEATLNHFIEKTIPKLVLWHFNFMFTPFVPRSQVPAWLNIEEDYAGFTKLDMQNTFRKMYLEEETIFDRIPKAKIKIQKEKCTDPVTGEKRAAAANAGTNEICFSSDEILANSPAEELRGYILGLALHEYSHLRGTTEPEAEMIQMVGRYLSAVDGVILERIENHWSNSYDQEEAQQPLEKLLKKMDGYSDTKLALGLVSVSHQISEDLTRLSTVIELGGLSPWSAKQRLDAGTALVKAANLNSFLCSLPETMIDKSDMYPCHPKESMDAMMLGESSEVGVTNLWEKNDTRILVPQDWKIRKLSVGNREAVRAELTDLLAIMRDLIPKPEGYSGIRSKDQ